MDDFDPDIENRGSLRRAYPDCGLLWDFGLFVDPWDRLGLTHCLPALGSKVADDIVVLNIGQSRLRVTDQADESCGKMAQPVSREVGGNRRWQGGSSHALGTVTVNCQAHNFVSKRMSTYWW